MFCHRKLVFLFVCFWFFLIDVEIFVLRQSLCTSGLNSHAIFPTGINFVVILLAQLHAETMSSVFYKCLLLL